MKTSWFEILRSLVLAMAALLAASCAGDGTGVGTGVPFDGSFESLQINIFNAHCVKCHYPGGPGPFSLLPGEAYGNIVNVPSNEKWMTTITLDRVEPGDPDMSYLYLKIIGDPDISGKRMPRDGPPYLNDIEIAAVRDWIETGAPPPAP